MKGGMNDGSILPSPRLRRVLDARPPSTAGRRFVLALACACVVALIGAGRLFLPQYPQPAKPSPLAFLVGGHLGACGDSIVSNDAMSRTIEFTDGTRIELAASSVARVMSLDAHGGRILLERGTLRTSFRHHDTQTHWLIEAGPILVEVTGTRFDVTWDPASDSFTLAMHEGSVALQGCGLPARASNVDVVRVTCRQQAIPSTFPGALADPAPGTETTTSNSGPTQRPTHQRARKAERGTSAGDARGTAIQVEVEEGAAVLLARANEARRTGQAAVARWALEEIRRQFVNRPIAVQAAFDLGTVAFDLEHHPAEAATWFRTYRSAAPNGPLAAESLGRMMESLAAAGDELGAARAADTYVNEYPGGSHARLAQRLLRQRTAGR